MAKKAIVKKARIFASLLAEKFKVKEVILFGSYARGTEKPNSDIDIAVVLHKTPLDILKTESEFFKIRRTVDLRIEPLLMDENSDPSGFFANIRKNGQVVFQLL